MLSADFIDWWFAPWRDAPDAMSSDVVPCDATAHSPMSTDALSTESAANNFVVSSMTNDVVSQRDGYRDWCSQASISSELPHQFDPQWCDTALIKPAGLQRAAELFMGLIAARQPLQTHRTTLNKLPFDDRKWCLSLAATQLLPAYSVDHPEADDSLVTRGLAELAIRLNAGFPGLWSRLQLRLPPTHRAAVQLRIQNSWADRETITRSAVRSQRCWRLCTQRSEVTG